VNFSIHKLEIRACKFFYAFINILGDPDYYTKFDYQTTSKFNVRTPFDVPDEAFMIKPLVADGLKDTSGIIEYPKAFE
jgi:predicted N-acetyltransferase YhbS